MNSQAALDGQVRDPHISRYFGLYDACPKMAQDFLGRRLYLPGYVLICFLFKEYKMLHYSIIFFVIAIVAGVLGFGGIAGSAAGIAKILFGGFLILAILSLIFGRKR